MLYRLITENMQLALDIFATTHKMLQVLYGSSLEAKLDEASVCLHALQQQHAEMCVARNKHEALVHLKKEIWRYTYADDKTAQDARTAKRRCLDAK